VSVFGRVVRLHERMHRGRSMNFQPCFFASIVATTLMAPWLIGAGRRNGGAVTREGRTAHGLVAGSQCDLQHRGNDVQQKASDDHKQNEIGEWRNERERASGRGVPAAAVNRLAFYPRSSCLSLAIILPLTSVYQAEAAQAPLAHRRQGWAGPRGWYSR